MLSLQQILLEKLQQGTPDLGDLKPNSSRLQQVSTENYSNPSSTLYQSYSDALTSDSQQQNLWAIFNFAKGVSRDNSIINLFHYICKSFESKDQIVEYNAILCATEIAHSYGSHVVHNLLTAILNRINASPYIEYGVCFKNLVPSIETQEIKKLILPPLVELMNKGDPFQHLSSYMLCSLPLSNLGLKSEFFDHFISSPIFIASYLSSISKILCQLYGISYIATNLLQKLLPMTKSRENTREGAINSILQCVDNINDQNVYIFILSAFTWASSNDSIALTLISHGNIILTKKHTEFPSKFREFASKISSSNNVNNKIRLCNELSKSQAILQGLPGNIKAILKSLAEDQDVEVRLAILSNFPVLFNNCNGSQSNANTRDFLLQMLFQFYSDGNPRVQEYLMSASTIYTMFKSQLKTLTPLFLKIFERGLNKWRNAAACIKTCTQFPDEIVKTYSSTMINLVNTALVKWPHPLSDPVIIFYVHLFQCNCRLKESNDEIMNQIVAKFSQNLIYSIRITFIRLSLTLIIALRYEFFVSHVWPFVISLKNDVVPSVRAAFVTYLPRFRNYFRQIGDTESVASTDVMFDSMKNDSDPLVLELWNTNEHHFLSPNSGDKDYQSQPAHNIVRNALKTLPTLTTSSNALQVNSDSNSRKRKSSYTSMTPTPEPRNPIQVMRKSIGRRIPQVTPKPNRTVVTNKAKSRLPGINQTNCH